MHSVSATLIIAFLVVSILRNLKIDFQRFKYYSFVIGFE